MPKRINRATLPSKVAQSNTLHREALPGISTRIFNVDHPEKHYRTFYITIQNYTIKRYNTFREKDGEPVTLSFKNIQAVKAYIDDMFYQQKPNGNNNVNQ